MRRVGARIGIKLYAFEVLDGNDVDHTSNGVGTIDRRSATAKHVEKLMEARADKPDSANGLRKVLREMMKVAKKLEWRDDDPTQGVKKIKPKKKGGNA